MSNKTGADGDRPDPSINPAADLDLLNRARSSVAIDQFLDVGPWWYAPLFATMIGGAVLATEAPDSSGRIVAGLVALAAVAVVVIHNERHRTIYARPSRRSFWPVFVTVIAIWAILASWGTAVSTLGYDRFVPGYAALAWLLTTGVLLAGRAALLAWRRSRTPVLS